MIIVIPANMQREDKNDKKLRDQFRERAISTVLRSYRDEFIHVQAKQRSKIALKHLDRHNGLDRNGGRYIELPSIVKSYPHRDDYALNVASENDVEHPTTSRRWY